MSMAFFGVEIERNVLAFLVELRAGCLRQAFRQGGLPLELMRKLARRKHRFGVGAGSLAHAGIERQTGRTGLCSGLICQIQKLLFGCGIEVAERNVGGGCRGRF